MSIDLPMPTMTPIASDAHHAVAPQRYEIMLRDGSSIGLHQVWMNSAPVLLLRALRHGDSLIVFDLASVSRELAADLPATPTRDVPGLVFYSLRSKYATADELVLQIMQHIRAILPVNAAANQAQGNLFEQVAA